MISDIDSQNVSVVANEVNKVKKMKKILALLREQGDLTTPELCKQLKVSLPSCITWLNSLLEQEYIECLGCGDSSGGRKPMLYGLQEDRFYVISCEITRFTAKLAIFNCKNKVISQIITIDTHIDDDELVEKLYQSAEQLISQNNLPKDRVSGLGVAMPGLIDPKTGVNYTIKNKKNQHIRRDLNHRFNKLVYIDNDARMSAYGEFAFGSGLKSKDAVVVHWSWGVGLGMIINGQLCRGSKGFAGEFSHIPMVENGELCICGKRGCLETIASSNTIMRRVKQGIEDGDVSWLLEKFKDNPDEITPEDVISSAFQGDEFCISILHEVGKSLGRGLAYVVQLINPELIVLNGPLASAKKFVLLPIQQSLNRLCLEKILGNTEVVLSEIGDQSTLLGTSEMVFQKIFTEMSFDCLS